LRRLGDQETKLLLGVDRAVPVVEELDRKLRQRAAVTAEPPRFLQRRLPLLGLDAILLVGTTFADARNLNEPSHQISVPD
jgi:hypothetical protein